MDWDIPISFKMVAEVFGLQVVHEMPEEISMSQTKSNFNATKSNMSDLLPGSMYSKGNWDQFSESVMRTMRSKDNSAKNNLKVLNFQGCTINKPSTQKFILWNLSGIKTSFNFCSLNFEPASYKLPAAI